ncbi:DUF4426 domain-containing protein [Motilimonas sp. KMU-193]|uniref:DUF4426 domain-containing protein n=1 Tax=Motilimonas sp. KMU-193 TaxID=3388668 RepID=UPI00396B3280
MHHLKALALSLSTALMLLLSPASFAEQKQTFANLDVHYIAFNSTFLTPKIARAYKIKRSAYNALINISVLDTQQLGNPSVPATLSGSAKNLLGNVTQLEFREVKEGDAIYYLAELPFRHEETFTFDIKINSQGKNNKLKFVQKFYVEAD